MSRPKILHCITVYNGRAFVPRAIESALRLDRSEADIDVLVLDDASPEPGWSEELAAFCKDRGAQYYRTPRNLGIPRNVNLGMLTAVKRGYDYVVISNSDVIYPKTLLSQMLRVAQHDRVGSVTAMSNNVSVYSLPNLDPNRYLSEQDVVEWVNACVNGQFGDAAMDIPAGISFCILIPTSVVRDVGLTDPCFGRGYCEETDWSLRSLKMNYRICLAPGTFVFHHGRGSNLDAGLVSVGATTVPRNEAIIDLRYPQFRTQVGDFLKSGMMQQAHHDAVERIVKDAGKSFGYTVEVGWLRRESKDEMDVRVQVVPEGQRPVVEIEFRGFRHELPLMDGSDVSAEIRRFFGRDPECLNLLDRGEIATALRGAFAKGAVKELRNYPSRI